MFSDIIKTTALYVARNGQKFLNGLLERENMNPQFDFLKPNHSLFGYFTYLVDSYSRCLLPKKEEMDKYIAYAKDSKAIMGRATERYLWERKQREMAKKKEVNEEEKEQIAAIDWYDFAVVETITFVDNEPGYPAHVPFTQAVPIQPSAYSIMEPPSLDIQLNDDIQITQEIPTSQRDIIKPVYQPKYDADMKILNIKRRPEAKQTVTGPTQRCPMCKELISVDEYNDHIKYELIDPKWKDVKKELEERRLELSLARPDEVLNNLTDFSRYRPDLFGEVDEQIAVEERKKKEKKLQNFGWEGVDPKMSRTTASIAMLNQQTRKNLEENMKTNTKNK